jgi:iron(III) transport system substrate-binding protein
MKVAMRRTFLSALAFGAAGFVLAGLDVRPAAAQAPAGKLVLYTSQPERDAAQTVAGFRKAYPGVEVEVFRSGTTEVMGKLAAELSAGQPKADVLLIADAASMESLKRDGRLLPYPDAKVAGLAPGSFDADRTYFGSKLITTGIAVNTSAKSRPTSWADLAKPEYKGQIAMPSPLYSGAAAIMLGTMTARSDLGWGWFEKLKASDTIAVRGNGAVMNAVANGEKPYGVLVDFMAFNAKAKGSPIDFVFPAEGLPAVTEPVAMLKTTANPAAARAFVDFILSDEGQKLAVAMGYIPARASVGMPPWLPAGTRINLMPTDIGAVVQSNAANLKRFAELFGN